MATRKAQITRIFTVRHSLILRGTALRWLTDMLTHHEVLEDDIEETVEVLARECAREEDAAFVDEAVLQKVYDRLQVSGPTLTQQPKHDSQPGDDAALDKWAHFSLTDAFSQPLFHYVPENHRGFEREKGKGKMLAGMKSKSKYLRDRYHVIRQVVERNEHFAPPALPGGAAAGLGGGAAEEREEFMKLTSIAAMLGRPGQRFLLFGLLGRLPSGAYSLEDLDGTVRLDLRSATPAEGMFTEGAFVLVEGEYQADETFKVSEIGHPPSEQRDSARKMFAHLDFTGAGAMSLAEEAALRKKEESSDDQLIFMSDVQLDAPKTLASLRRILQQYDDLLTEHGLPPPPVWVLCGNFSEKPWLFDGESITRYKKLFADLADLLALFPAILHASVFVLVPGPTDPYIPATLPRPSLPSGLVKPLLKVGGGGRVLMASNPCRIRWMGQEIVVFREDVGRRMSRNQVDGLRRESGGEDDLDVKRYLVQTILDQAHLCPLPINVRPVLWEYDHSMRLYPMPTALVLADSYPPYDLTYEACHVFNPGSFTGSRFAWANYSVRARGSEISELPDY